MQNCNAHDLTVIIYGRNSKLSMVVCYHKLTPSICSVKNEPEVISALIFISILINFWCGQKQGHFYTIFNKKGKFMTFNYKDDDRS